MRFPQFLARQKYRFDIGQGFLAIVNFAFVVIAASDKITTLVHLPSQDPGSDPCHVGLFLGVAPRIHSRQDAVHASLPRGTESPQRDAERGAFRGDKTEARRRRWA